jgi:hypothetical protein
MENENQKSAQMNQLTATFFFGAIAVMTLTIFLIRKLDKE